MKGKELVWVTHTLIHTHTNLHTHKLTHTHTLTKTYTHTHTHVLRGDVLWPRFGGRIVASNSLTTTFN